MRVLTLCLVPVLLLSACATPRHNQVVTAATAEERAALIDRVKSLAGTWEKTDANGTQTACVFSVSSNGSAVREVMFPGAGHEMTNMYTMDGPDLLLTHYCGIGNQPHMRAKAAGAKPDRIEFQPAGVSNLTAADQMHMGRMTLVFVDADHIREEWDSIQKGKEDHHATFELTRKK